MARQFSPRTACPEGFEPNSDLVNANKNRVQVMRDPVAAIRNSDWVVTDVWASMGQEDEQTERLNRFSGYQVNHELMSYAKKDAVFMHCLPAHRGEEVSAELMEDELHTVVWDEAENRLHAQKALMLFLVNG